MSHLHSTPQNVLFYPSASLSGQLRAWSEQCGGWQMRISFERSLAGIRRRISGADFVLIDATTDPAQASDAYFQSFNALGPDSMAVYTEIVHDGLENLVRRLGVMLLLGPMSVSEWDDFFEHKFPRTIPLSSAQGDLPNLPPELIPREERTVKKSYPIKSIAG
jgi:hypothetical protein